MKEQIKGGEKMSVALEELTKKVAACQAACNHCYDACLKEDDVDMMRECIRTDNDCSYICGMVLDFAHKDSPLFNDIVELCAKACEACAEECEKHDHHEHCLACAKACRECAEACRAYIA